MSADVYLAAPFFSYGECLLNDSLLHELEGRGIRVFYPARDGILMREMLRQGQDYSAVAKKVWECDRDAIDGARCVVAVLDGRAVDEGVCVEIGIAATLGKPIVGYLSDERRQFTWGLNPMVAAPLIRTFATSASLTEYVVQSLGVGH